MYVEQFNIFIIYVSLKEDFHSASVFCSIEAKKCEFQLTDITRKPGQDVYIGVNKPQSLNHDQPHSAHIIKPHSYFNSFLLKIKIG